MERPAVLGRCLERDDRHRALELRQWQRRVERPSRARARGCGGEPFVNHRPRRRRAPRSRPSPRTRWPSLGRGPGSSPCPPAAATRSGSVATAPRSRSVRWEGRRRPPRRRSSRPARRRAGTRHARSSENWVSVATTWATRPSIDALPPPSSNVPERSTVATPSATETSRSVVPSGIAVTRPSDSSAPVGPVISASSEARATAGVDATVLRTGAITPSRSRYTAKVDVSGVGCGVVSTGPSSRAAARPPRPRRTRRRRASGAPAAPRARPSGSSREHRARHLFGNQDAASCASAASVRPTTGANLKPWPEQAAPTTMRPWRSSTKPSSAVLV